MKKFIYMAVAAIAALSSCTKDDAILNEGGLNKTGVTTFTATIEGDGATRATYNATAKKAEWEATTDQISIGGAVYTAQTTGATTTFTGTGAAKGADQKYHAYFPASLYSGTTASLPATMPLEDGKFNMPMYAESETEVFTFKNLCGVLAITVPNSQMSSVKSIEVSSDQQLNGEIDNVTAEGVLTFKDVTLTDAEKKVTLTASTAVTITTSVTFYVPVPAGTHNPLVISVSDGTNTKMMITKKTGGVEVARNKIYPVTFAENFPEYVEIGGKKWATTNLGAMTVAGSLATCAGDYYQWGSVNKLYESISWSGTSASFSNLTSGGFIADNREIKDSDVPTVLPAANDVVTQTLGNGWRMPTKADFEALHKACTGSTNAATSLSPLSSSTPAGGVYWLVADQEILPEYTGVVGILYVDKDNTNKRLFFPAAGYATNTSIRSVGEYSRNWSSSHKTDNATSAYNLQIREAKVDPSGFNSRYYGCTVRPVKGQAN